MNSHGGFFLSSKAVGHPSRQYISSQQERFDGRDAVVAARTQLINACRGMVKAIGGRPPKCTTAASVGKVKTAIPPELRAALRPLLASIRVLSEQTESCDRWIRSLAEDEYPQTDVNSRSTLATSGSFTQHSP